MHILESLKSKQPASVLHLSLIALFIVVAYFPALYAPFVFDDIPNIILNPAVQPDSFSEIFTAVHSKVSGSRPLAMLTFAANFLFAGLDVFGYHVFNLVIHLCNAVALYYCVITVFSVPGFRLKGNLNDYEIRNLAFWSVLLWALNPVQHQAVTYIVQRMTSLATMYYLLSILVFLQFRAGRLSTPWAWGLIILFFTAGMGCKEIVITMPVCLLLLDRMLIKNRQPINVKSVIAVAAGVFFISLIYIHDQISAFFTTFPNRNFSPYERLLTEPRILWDYLSILFFPVPDRLYLDADIEVSRSLTQPLTTLFSIMAIPVALLSGWLLLKRIPLLSFALVFYFITTAIEASFLNLGLAYLHRLYLPSLFIFPGLLSCIPARIKTFMNPALIVIVALFVYGTQLRNEAWQNSASLWKIDYTKNTNPGSAIANGGIALVELGRYDDAIKLLYPVVNGLSGAARYSFLHTLALAHYYKGAYAAALTYLKQINDDYEEFDQVLFYQGLTLLNMNLEAGLQMEALEENYPNQPYLAILIAEKLRKARDYGAAAQVLEEADRTGEDVNAAALNLVRAYLANIYLDMEKYEQAYDLYLEMIKLDPDAYFAWQQIYAMQVSAGDLEHAKVIKAMLESKGVVLSESAR